MTVSELISLLQKFDQTMQVKTCSPILWGGTQLNALEPDGVGVVGSVEFGDGELMVDESRFYSKDGKECRFKDAIDRGEPLFVLRLK